MGRAARRRVDRQAGQGHPAGRRRAARRRRTPTATTACSSTCATPTSPTTSTTRRSRRSRKAGHPMHHAAQRTAPTTSGAIFFFAEFATAVAGWVLEINPFDQPNVQEAKDNTNARARRGRAGRARRRRRSTTLLDGLAPPRYVAIMGYLPTSDEFDAAVARAARALIRERTQRRRPRSATGRASCTRPASSTRAARRPAASCSSSTTPTTTSRSPASRLHVRAR